MLQLQQKQQQQQLSVIGSKEFIDAAFIFYFLLFNSIFSTSVKKKC